MRVSGAHRDPTVEVKRHPLQPKSFSGGSHTARFQHIRPYVEGKRVLDIGCGSGHWREDWMHRQIRDSAREATGIELDANAVAKMRAQGFDLHQGDAQTFSLGRKFEVIHAGELIEHLENPGAFLRAVKKHLEPGGTVVVTTPNAFGVSNFIYRLWGEVRFHDEHVAWYCDATLRQLLERCGFEVLEVKHLPHETPGRVRSLMARAVRAALPERLAWRTLLAVGRLRDEA